MRTLCLMQPNLCGGDAVRWQQFLAGRGLFNSRVDGVFGHLSDQATRSYQTNTNVGNSGSVDDATLTQAANDGFAGLGTPGMDASMNCAPFAAQLATAGIQFVARYYSRFSGKALSPEEANALSQAGLQLVVVYQDAGDTIDSFSADKGRDNATRALAQAAAIGQPAGSGIYFSADFDPDEGQIAGPLTDHFRAIHDAFAAAGNPYRVGVYGSGLLCASLLAAGLVQLTWLSQSTGFRNWLAYCPQANIVQSAPSRNLVGVSIDDDIAQTDDYGQFRLG